MRYRAPGPHANESQSLPSWNAWIETVNALSRDTIEIGTYRANCLTHIQDTTENLCISKSFL